MSTVRGGLLALEVVRRMVLCACEGHAGRAAVGFTLRQVVHCQWGRAAVRVARPCGSCCCGILVALRLVRPGRLRGCRGREAMGVIRRWE